MPNGQFFYQESTMTMTVDKVLYTGQAQHHGWPERRIPQL